MTTHEKPLSSMIDYYKVTMGNVILEKHPDAEVTFTFKNRNSKQPLSEYVAPDALQSRLDVIRQQGFTPEEVAYYAALKAQNGDARFTEEYLNHLAGMKLPEVRIATDPITGDLAIDSIGPWVDVSLWETVIMSEVNEEYYSQLLRSRGLSIEDLYNEGENRLTMKIQKLKQRPDVKFADFGTRRRFSIEWHEHVIRRLANELPDNFVGTSNPWFAYRYNLAPIGTFAHEMPMVYAGIADSQGEDPLIGHKRMLQDWQESYRGDLSIALTDTFGSEFFFNDFTAEQARRWNGLRHDSGDPIEFGEHAIAFYEKHGVDPTTKTIVFSDGLDIDTIITLADHFKGKVNVLFGWGTSLMNDMGLPANNIVMKATHVGMTDTVKLSDNPGKHTGPQDKVDYYVKKVDEANMIAKRALIGTVSIA